jgi:hypothetical protein
VFEVDVDVDVDGVVEDDSLLKVVVNVDYMFDTDNSYIYLVMFFIFVFYAILSK